MLAGLESRTEKHSPGSGEERAGVQGSCSDRLGAKKPTDSRKPRVGCRVQSSSSSLHDSAQQLAQASSYVQGLVAAATL